MSPADLNPAIKKGLTFTAAGMLGVTFFGLFLTPVFYPPAAQLKRHTRAQAACREATDDRQSAR
jgi:hypothetical protein